MPERGGKETSKLASGGLGVAAKHYSPSRWNLALAVCHSFSQEKKERNRVEVRVVADSFELLLHLNLAAEMQSLRQSCLRPAVRAFSSSARISTIVPMRAVESEGTSRVPAEAPEGGAITPAGVVSGAPGACSHSYSATSRRPLTRGRAEEMHRRPVRIYRPAPPATSSAKGTSHNWRIDWDILQGAGRWENPLMGWASS